MRMASRRRGRRHRTSPAHLFDAGREDAAPELSLVNLVDLMLVFAVGLMLALSAHARGGEATTNGTAGASPTMAEKLAVPQRMKPAEQSQSGTGARIGVAYRLANGDIVYVPEASDAPKNGAARP